MEDKHRKAIQKIYSSLVEQTDLDSMVSFLFEKRIFSEQMIEPYKNSSVPTRDRKQQLYMDITHRGPRAFPALLEALVEAGLWHLVREMDPDSPYSIQGQPRPPQRLLGPHSPNNNETFRSTSTFKKPKPPEQPNRIEEPSTSPIPADLAGAPAETPPFKVIKSTKFHDGTGEACYRTRGRPRGVLLVFSYVSFEHDIAPERRGADKDCQDLKYLFMEMGFSGCFYRNLTEKETHATLQESRGVLQGAECVFVVVSSHGHARSRSHDLDIRCSDGKLISFSTIIDYFNNVSSPHLVGVPKVFIFQVCRGDKVDDAWLSCPEPGPEKLDLLAGDTQGERDPAAEAAGADRGSAAEVLQAGAGAALSTDGATAFRDFEPPRTPPTINGKKPQRIYSDILIAHSTVPGYVSNRAPASGSLYVQALCAVFAAHAHARAVQQLFRDVDTRLQASRLAAQTSSVDSWGFNKLLYLHPGLFDPPS